MTPEQESWIDLLVDGELDEPRRRALLLALEVAPDGWRRCALAFLEAQTWRGTLGGAAVAAVAPARQLATPIPATPAVAPAMRKRSGRLPARGSLLALAASLAIAFATGHWWRGAVPAESAPQGMAKNLQPPPPAAPEPAPGSGHSLDGAQLVSLEVAHGQGTQRHTVQLPVFDHQKPQEQWLAQAEAAGPTPAVLAELERRGIQVSQRRQLVPVTLSDGRELIVPVKEVDLQFQKPLVYQ